MVCLVVGKTVQYKCPMCLTRILFNDKQLEPTK